MVTKKQYVEYAKECETKADRLEKQVCELEAEVTTRINERDAMQFFLTAAQKERDDIIDSARQDNAAYEKQIESLEQRYNDAHQEAVQTSRQLHEAKQKVESLNRMLERFDRDFNKAIAACHQFLIVECGRDERPASVREMSIQERFVYHLLDVLNGK